MRKSCPFDPKIYLISKSSLYLLLISIYNTPATNFPAQSWGCKYLHLINQQNTFKTDFKQKLQLITVTITTIIKDNLVTFIYYKRYLYQQLNKQ